jgi:DNA modification methylase
VSSGLFFFNQVIPRQHPGNNKETCWHNFLHLGKHGRYRTNVWNYRGVNTLRSGREDELAKHPTNQPVRMLADTLLDYSHRERIVLNPFGGSGSTLLAAARTGRRGRVNELETKYVDAFITRWQQATGQPAIHGVTGQPFGQVKEQANEVCDVG